MSLSEDNRFICSHYDWPKIKGTEGWKKIKVLWGKWIYVKSLWLKWNQSTMDWNEIELLWLIFGDCVSVKRKLN